MSAAGLPQRASTQLYFAVGDATCYGAWHLPHGRAHDVGVVICPAFGREELSSHRSLRRLAAALASQGLPVMRFDYPGCGDSSGDEHEAQLVERWVDAGCQAGDELRRLSGATRLIYVGLRIGATIASLAAARRGDVAALVALVPVVSGRAFVREATMLGSMTGGAPAQTATSQATDSIETGGFVLSAGTAAALAALDLLHTECAPAPRLLVIDRDDMPVPQRWVARLSAQGAQVLHRQLPGYAAMMQDPERSQPALDMVDAVSRWVVEQAGDKPAPVPRNAQSHRISYEAGGLTESVVTIELGTHQLEAVLCAPSGQPPGRPAVLLPNAGATRRIGPGRLHVQLARFLAGRGLTVLRIDQSGLGESLAHGAGAEQVVYADGALTEVEAAARWLRQQSGGADLKVVGLCSGAYHGFKLGVQTDAVQAVVAINPLTFFWDSAAPPQLLAYQAIEEMNRYRGASLDAARWLKLLRGQIDPRAALRIMARRLQATVLHRLRDAARLLRLPVRNDLAGEVRALLARGTGLQFVFSQDDPGLALLLEQGGASIRRQLRDGRLGLVRIDQADHTFTRAASRLQLLQTVGDLLGQLPARPDVAAAPAPMPGQRPGAAR